MNSTHTPRLVDLDCLEKCPSHPQNIIIYYCDIHDDVGCYECMSKSHNFCTTKNIDEIAKGTKDSIEYKTLLKDMDGIKCCAEEKEMKAEENKLNSDIYLSTVLNDIRTLREDIDSHLDEMEHTVSSEAKQVNLDYRLRMNEIVRNSKDTQENVDHLLKEIKKAEGRETKLFIKMKQGQADIMKYKHEIEHIHFEKKAPSLIFEPNSQLVDMFRKSNTFGTVMVEAGKINTIEDVEYERHHPGNITMDNEPDQTEPHTMSNLQAKQEEHNALQDSSQKQNEIGREDKDDIDGDLEDIKPYTESKINTKLLSDTDDCDISGMDMLTENEIVLADYNNRSIKVIDLAENKIKDELKLAYHPYDLTVPSESTIAVTLTNTIQMIRRSHLLGVGEIISVDGECYGIASNKDKLFVSFIKPHAKVEILNLHGDVLKKIELGIGGRGLFKRPRYIAVSPNEKFIYVSDFETDSIVQLSLEGDQVNVFCDAAILNGPYGIQVDKNGHVFVCNYGNDNIYEFSTDLSVNKMVLSKTDGIESPQSIYINSRQNKLFVACTDSADCNEIQIFIHCSETKF